MECYGQDWPCTPLYLIQHRLCSISCLALPGNYFSEPGGDVIHVIFGSSTRKGVRERLFVELPPTLTNKTCYASLCPLQMGQQSMGYMAGFHPHGCRSDGLPDSLSGGCSQTSNLLPHSNLCFNALEGCFQVFNKVVGIFGKFFIKACCTLFELKLVTLECCINANV